MDAAAKAARQKAKATQAPKTEPSVAKKQEATMSPGTPEARQVCFRRRNRQNRLSLRLEKKGIMIDAKVLGSQLQL